MFAISLQIKGYIVYCQFNRKIHFLNTTHHDFPSLTHRTEMNIKHGCVNLRRLGLAAWLIKVNPFGFAKALCVYLSISLAACCFTTVPQKVASKIMSTDSNADHL